MAHTRKGVTPYSAQLRKLLSTDGRPSVFSAATLKDLFEVKPNEQLRTTVKRIHQELRQAWEAGEVVAFVAADGTELCEAEFCVNGSATVAHPQVFGVPGADSPVDGYVPTTYQEAPRHTALRSDDDAEDEMRDGDGSERSDMEDVVIDDAETTNITEEEARAQVDVFPSAGSVAPEWLPERVLREWIALPEVCKQLVHGLDSTQGADKFELIRAGVNRRVRSWRAESTVAGNLAKTARGSEAVWRNVARTALKRHYLRDDAFNGDALGRIAADPDGVYDSADLPPAGVLLCALALGADETTLRLIADDCATVLGELTVLDKATTQQERIDALEVEAKELRRSAKDADKTVRAAAQRERSLLDEVERLRTEQEQAGTAADSERRRIERELRARAEAAEAQAEELRAEADRVEELEARLQGLEDANGRLVGAEAALLDERRLRVQAEKDAERHIARARQITDELTRVSDSRNLPVDNPEALVETLARPIGQAARHAAERLVAGRARPHDNLMLELAATLAQMTRRLDADVVIIDAGEAPPIDDEPTADTATPAMEADVADVVPVPADAPAADDQSADEQPDASEPQPVSEPAPRARRRRNRIKVRPLGGAGEVGGSAILITNTSGHTILLDCGQRVRGEYGLDTEPIFHRRIGQDGRLHAILLSHAHIDHVGSLPLLHREQAETQDEPIPVYMTEPTRQLAKVMLQDSAKIQHYREQDRAELGFLDYGAGAMQEAAYSLADVEHVMSDEVVQEVSIARAHPIPGTSFVARFLPVAHVLGSCAIHLTDTENDQTLLYTGDLGPITDPQITLPHYSLDEMLGADVVIMESTYGNLPPNEEDGKRSRGSLSGRERAVKLLSDEAQRCYGAGGAVLLPAFSLGRTQELAMLIHRAIQDGQAPPGEIVVGGMGEKITQIYESYSRGSNPWARAENMPRFDELGGRLRSSPDLGFDDVVDEVLEKGFTYIIASPAMLGNGWSRTFLDRMVDDPANAILMTGYVPPHGGKIPRLHQMRSGETIDLGSRRTRIQAQFRFLKGLSAHAPSSDLRKFAQYMARQADHVAFGMVHGEEAKQIALAQDVGELPNASARPLQNGAVWNPSST